jgi:ubiquinone/menaquinone biosynthesis C-methylase UbiE
MSNYQNIIMPDAFDCKVWVDRWDLMQNRYLVKRQERFEIINNIIRATNENLKTIVDLGCGTGSLMASLLEIFPDVKVIGIDFDPTMLILASERLKPFGRRAKVEFNDIRTPSWTKVMTESVDVIVSATALHWLNSSQLNEIYKQIVKILKRGGLFLNADHVGSESAPVQKYWEANREKIIKEGIYRNSDDWDGFWNEYAKALKVDIEEMHKNITGGWEGGVEEGLPLSWHFDKLRENGFSTVDCFWRSDGDAIYGGIK